MSKFQIIFIAIFVIFIVIGVALFATYKSSQSTQALPEVTIWGTFPKTIVDDLVQNINNTREIPLSVNYIEKTTSTFDKAFIEALARGKGPDAILVSEDRIFRHADKITLIPPNVLTERDFKNTYIPEAELYLTSDGTMALPFIIDPMVMYWNRDIFTNAGIATYPKFWDEFSGLAGKINTRDSSGNIKRTALALGEFKNISHAREILGSLLLQAGNPVTRKTTSDNGLILTSALGNGQSNGTQSATNAINFFTQFADPRNQQYSWNRSLPVSKNYFLSGSLAIYFGFASELLDLRAKNPNLDFDVAPLPQPRSAANRSTYGTIYGLSIVKNSTLQSAAYTVIKAMTEPSAMARLSQSAYLPPVRRDMLATGSTDPNQAIFYDSALISRGWLDTDLDMSNQIFQNMVESVTSGRVDVYSSIQTAQQDLDMLYKNP